MRMFMPSSNSGNQITRGRGAGRAVAVQTSFTTLTECQAIPLGKKPPNPQEGPSVRKWGGRCPSTPTLICLVVAGALMLVAKVSLLEPQLKLLLCLPRNFCGLTCRTKRFVGSIKEMRCHTRIAYVICDFSMRAQSLPSIPLPALFFCQAVLGLDTLCSTGTVLQFDVVNCLTVS